MKRFLLLIGFVFLSGAPVRAAFINDSAPAFTLKDLSGEDRSLKDFAGQVVFINFWASWCPPCKKEFPEINELANEYKDHNVRVLAIILDKSLERVAGFLEKMNVDPGAVIILQDPSAKVVANYVARSMPTSFVVDHKGIIRFVHFGYDDKDPAKWRAEIDALLPEIPNNVKKTGGK